MRAGSVLLYHLVQPRAWHLGAAAILLLAVLAYLVVAHLASGAGGAPEPLLAAPFRWLPDSGGA